MRQETQDAVGCTSQGSSTILGILAPGGSGHAVSDVSARAGLATDQEALRSGEGRTSCRQLPSLRSLSVVAEAGLP